MNAPIVRAGLRLGWQGWISQARLHPWRLLIQIISIGIGITLGLAVHLIHASALDSFAAGVRQFSGAADRIVKGPKTGFDIAAADALLEQDSISALSPVIELEVAVDGLDKPVKWLGLDFMRAAAVTPQWIGSAESADDFFDSHAVFLSPTLMTRLHASPGQTVKVLGPQGTLMWRIAGTLEQAPADSLIAVADIAAVQWRFGLGNLVSRLDIKAAEGVGASDLDDSIRANVPAGLWVEKPDDAGSRGAAVSRAYRVNLTILALVALLTGSFLVYASQSLSAIERARQWALMRALGADTQLVYTLILTEASISGLLGSLLGTGAGIAVAHLVLTHLGSDLGGGFFQGQKTSLIAHWIDCVPFVALGWACSLVGVFKPALQAARIPGAAALKPGSMLAQTGAHRTPKAGLAALAACPALALSPPIAGLPLGAYAAIAAGLFGGIACMPALLQRVTGTRDMPEDFADLSRLRTRYSAGHSGIALSGIVASFSLVVAMAVMVHSFRASLSEWLEQVLPAPLYLRVQAGDGVGFSPSVQARLSQLDGVAKAEFWTSLNFSITPERPAPALVVRPIDAKAPQLRLPLAGPAITDVPNDLTPVWVSEAMGSLYGWQTGSRQSISLPGIGRIEVLVAGVWRDYARQQGAVVMDVQAALQAGLNLVLTDAAFWPIETVGAGELTQAIKSAISNEPWAARTEFAQAAFIREFSMKIFDRSFAITYLLEAAAIGIGLMGIASTFAATALSRRHEFATLLALGAQRSDIGRMLLAEGVRVATVGMLTGLALGLLFSVILVKVVNPQSFHWTMDIHLPWLLLAVLSTTLVVLASLTAGLTGWLVVKRQVLDILKEETA